jgi:hypothetical protein
VLKKVVRLKDIFVWCFLIKRPFLISENRKPISWIFLKNEEPIFFRPKILCLLFRRGITRIKRIHKEFSGITRNHKESQQIRRNQKESKGIKRNQKESKGIIRNI